MCVDAAEIGTEKAGSDGEKKRFDDTILKPTGTPLFFSPEMCHIPAVPFHGRPADVWAAGITLCMLVSGELPFSGDNIPDIWKKVQEEPPELDRVLPPACSPLLREVLALMLDKDPNNRPTVKQLRKHKWVTRNDTEPLPEQPFLPLEITDDDIKQAVKRFSNTFTLVKAGKKWKSKLEQSRSRGTGLVAVTEASTEQKAPAPAEEPTAPSAAPSEAERI